MTGKEFPELAGWRFLVQEISMGVYTAVGTNPCGEAIEMTGTDPDALLDECKEAVLSRIRTD